MPCDIDAEDDGYTFFVPNEDILVPAYPCDTLDVVGLSQYIFVPGCGE